MTLTALAWLAWLIIGFAIGAGLATAREALRLRTARLDELEKRLTTNEAQLETAAGLIAKTASYYADQDRKLYALDIDVNGLCQRANPQLRRYGKGD